MWRAYGESRMVKKVWYYAQVGIYVALTGLALGCMLTNGVWMIELVILGLALVGTFCLGRCVVTTFNKYVWLKD